VQTCSGCGVRNPAATPLCTAVKLRGCAGLTPSGYMQQPHFAINERAKEQTCATAYLHTSLHAPGHGVQCEGCAANLCNYVPRASADRGWPFQRIGSKLEAKRQTVSYRELWHESRRQSAEATARHWSEPARQAHQAACNKNLSQPRGRHTQPPQLDAKDIKCGMQVPEPESTLLLGARLQAP
jgi:hypothetical protein